MKLSRAQTAYRVQQTKSMQRDIDFKLSFTEWYDWWLNNGIDKNQTQPNTGNTLCMCRFNDRGAYELGNIYLATRAQNSSDARFFNPIHRQKNRKAKTAKRVHTPAGVFDDAWQAAAHHKVSDITIRNRCRYQDLKWRDWYWLDQYHNGQWIHIPLGDFPTQRRAAQAMGVPVSTIARRRKSDPTNYYYLKDRP